MPVAPKILFVHYSDLDMTGGERMTLRLIEGMKRSGSRPVLLTQRLGPLAQATRVGGIETIILPLPNSLNRYDGEIFRYSAFRLLACAADLLLYNIRFGLLLRKGEFSAVWCSNIRALLSIGITARVLRIPVIWNIWLARQFGRATRRVYDLCYLLPNVIVTEYHGQAASVFPGRTIADQKITTVYTGLNPSAFLARKGTPDGKGAARSGLPRIVSCGRITPRKGLEYLLEATALLAARGKRIKVTIVGKPFSEADRQYCDHLKQQAHRQGIASLVTFADWRDDIRPYLNSADLYVSSSLGEGLPGAVREAQAAGLPVVATDAGGTAEALQDGVSGMLVPCGDAHALAAAIETMVADPELAASYGNAGRRRAAKRFSMETFIQNYSSVFQRVLS